MHAVGDIVDVTVGDIVGGRYGGVIDGVEVGDDVEGGLDDGVIDEGEMVVTTIASGASDSPAAVTRTDDGDDVAIKSTVYDSKTAVSPISVDTNDPNKTDATTSGMKAITTRHILRLRPTAKSTSRMERDPVRSSPVLGSPSLSSLENDDSTSITTDLSTTSSTTLCSCVASKILILLNTSVELEF
jgi:hypothetical protein